MEKKSIGSFLAALRKANGLTQEEVAQRLFVSNKTVSKWERDESSPDLALIPVLAEVFGVTCDDILRGERGEKEPGNEEKARIKAEKQMQRIFTHTINRFKSTSSIAAALTVLGIVCHFAVAYTYFTPLVAFGLGLAFLLASVVLEIMQLLRANAALQDGAMPGEGAISSATAFLLHRTAFAVFGFNVWALILLWPMVSAQGLDYVNSVLSLDAYRAQLPALLAICLAAAALAAYLARQWLGFGMDEKSMIAALSYKTGMTRRMAWMQGAFLLGVAALFFVPSMLYVWTGGSGSAIGGIVFLALLVVTFVVMAITFIRMLRGGKDRLERMVLLLLSIRNALFGAKIIGVFSSITVYVGISDPSPVLSYDVEGIPAALLQMVLITMVYCIIKYFMVSRQKGNEKAQAVS